MIDAVSWFALVILIVLIAAVVIAAAALASLPGRIARKRDHPQADAITACGWLGLLALPVWVVAMVWAYVRPRRGEPS